MSSSGASSAAHAQRLTALACFLLGICASNLRSENKTNYDGLDGSHGCALTVPIHRDPLFGSFYVTPPPSKVNLSPSTMAD